MGVYGRRLRVHICELFALSPKSRVLTKRCITFKLQRCWDHQNPGGKESCIRVRRHVNVSIHVPMPGSIPDKWQGAKSRTDGETNPNSLRLKDHDSSKAGAAVTPVGYELHLMKKEHALRYLFIFYGSHKPTTNLAALAAIMCTTMISPRDSWGVNVL